MLMTFTTSDKSITRVRKDNLEREELKKKRNTHTHTHTHTHNHTVLESFKGTICAASSPLLVKNELNLKDRISPHVSTATPSHHALLRPVVCLSTRRIEVGPWDWLNIEVGPWDWL